MSQFQFSPPIARTPLPIVKKTRKWKWWQWALIAAVVLVLLGAGITYSMYTAAVYTPTQASGKLVSFTIEPGQTTEEIAEQLTTVGILKQSQAFGIYLRLSGASNKLQSGNFQIPQNISIHDLVAKLQRASRDEATLRFIEGWRREEMSEYIDAQHADGAVAMTGTEFSNLALNPSQRLIDVLGKPMSSDDSLQGYLFPDTYVVDKDDTAEDLLAKMLETYKKRITSATMSGFAQQGLSEYEALTLAAIVERESHKGEERAIIAGILLTRLEQGIPLYVDATTQYALGYSNSEERWWRQNLTVDDLAVASPYNTRLNGGLPPHPICNPGLTAIEAVANPTKTDYLYYLHDTDGVARYAKTLDQHNANVAKYLR